jgi:ABC-type uncharacterized transport system permease subunit
VIHLFALLSYIGAFALWVVQLLRGAGAEARRTFAAAALTAAAVAIHGMALVDFWRTYGELPLVGPGAALSFLAFVGGLALVVMLPMRDAGKVALVLLPFVVVVQGVALALGIELSPRSMDFQGAGFVFHVALAFLGMQGLAVAFAAGVLYLIQHHELKEKRLGRFFFFAPPLATLETVGRIGLWVGFVSLSLALVVGWAWAVQNPGAIQLSDPKVALGVVSWFVFLGIFAVRRSRGSSEYRGALAAIVGFALVIGAYVALRLASGGSGLFL